MSWKPYLNDRLIKECDGFFIIKPAEENKHVTPLSCPVCDYLFRTLEDDRSYKKYGCCETCDTFWARPNLEKWKEGWRPDKSIVQEKLKEKKIIINLEIT